MSSQPSDQTAQSGEVSLGTLKIIAFFFALISGASLTMGLVGLNSEERLATVLSLTSGIGLGIFTLILVGYIIHESRSARTAASKTEAEESAL